MNVSGCSGGEASKCGSTGIQRMGQSTGTSGSDMRPSGRCCRPSSLFGAQLERPGDRARGRPLRFDVAGQQRSGRRGQLRQPHRSEGGELDVDVQVDIEQRAFARAAVPWRCPCTFTAPTGISSSGSCVSSCGGSVSQTSVV